MPLGSRLLSLLGHLKRPSSKRPSLQLTRMITTLCGQQLARLAARSQGKRGWAQAKRARADRARTSAMVAPTAAPAGASTAQSYDKLCERLKELSNLNAISGLLGWDEVRRSAIRFCRAMLTLAAPWLLTAYLLCGSS